MSAAADKPVPMACIKRACGIGVYCGRYIDTDKTFVFVDAAHAVRHYASSNVIRACGACVKDVPKELV